MLGQDTRAQVIAYCKETYQYRAYMSSGLTNVLGDDRDSLTSTLERLFLDVFRPLGVNLYLPHIWSMPGHNSQISPEEVYILDRLRIAESDFLMVCADYPSFGVGQEVEIAQSMGLRALIYRREGTPVSRMLLGSPGFHIIAGEDDRLPSKSIITYRDYDDLRRQLMNRTTELLSCLPAKQSRQATPNFGRRLLEVLRRERCSIEELAEKTGLTIAFIRHLTSDLDVPYGVLDRCELPRSGVNLDLTKYVNPGFWVLRSICRALDIPISDLVEPDVISSTKAQELEVRSQIERAAQRFALKRKLTDQQYQLLEKHIGEDDALKYAAARSAGSSRSAVSDLERAIERIWNHIQDVDK